MAIAPSAPRRKPKERAVVKAPTTQLGALNDVMSHVEFGQRVVVPAIKQTTEEILRAKSSLIDTTKALSVEREPWRDQIRTAQDRLFNIEENPEIINKVLGIFDSDFDRDAQIRKMQSGKFELNQITNRMVEAEALHGLEVGMAKTALAGVQSFYSMTKEGFLDTQSATLVGFEIRAGVRKEQVQLVEDTTLEKLTTWQNNPDKMPPALRGLEQLVTAELVHRDAKEKQLKALDISTSIAEQQLFSTQREAYFDQFDTVEQIGQAKARFKSDPSSAPPFILDNNFDEEAQNRQMISLELRTAKASADVGDMQARDMAMARAFSRTSSTDLKTIRNNMGDKQFVELIPGLPVTKTQLDAAIQIKKDAAHKQRIANATLQATILGMEESMNNAVSQAEMLARLNGPGGKISAKSKGALTTAQNIHALSGPYAANGSEADAVVMSKFWKVADDTISEEVKTAVANAPRTDKAGIGSFISNEGVMTTGAVSYAYANLTNEFAIAYDPVLGPGAQLYAQTLSEIIGTQSFSFAQTETELSFDSNEKEKGSRLSQAVTESDVRTQVSDRGFQLLLQNTLQELVVTKSSGPNADPEYDPNSPFASLLTPRGTLASSMYSFEGEKKFMYGQFYQALADAQLKGIADGTLMPGNDLATPIIDMIREMAPGLNDRFTQSPHAAALREIAFKDGIQGGIYKRLSTLRTKLPQLISNMQLQKDAMQEAIQQGIDNEVQSP